MSGPKSVTIERGGVRLHALDHGGTGRPVLLLLHGAAAHAHWWDWTAPRLADRFRPVAVDLRGHGDSAWAEDYSYEAFADNLAAWIAWARGEGEGPPALLAHSMGGVIALKLHEQARPELRALVVVDTPLRVDDRILEEVRSFGRRPSFPWGSLEEFVSKFRLIPSAGRADPAHLAHVARHSVQRLPDGSWLLKTDRSFHRDRTGADLRPAWRRVESPALLVVGEASDRLAPEDLEWVAENLPRVRVVVIPGAHHHVYMDEPEAFLRAVRGFLSGALS